MKKTISITEQEFWHIERCSLCRNSNIKLQDLTFNLGNTGVTIKLCDECIKVLSKEINDYLEERN